MKNIRSNNIKFKAFSPAKKEPISYFFLKVVNFMRFCHGGTMYLARFGRGQETAHPHPGQQSPATHHI